MTIFHPIGWLLLCVGLLIAWLFYSIADRLGIFASIKRFTAAWKSGRRFLGKDRP